MDNIGKPAGVIMALIGIIIGFFDVELSQRILTISLVIYLIFGDENK